MGCREEIAGVNRQEVPVLRPVIANFVTLDKSLKTIFPPESKRIGCVF